MCFLSLQNINFLSNAIIKLLTEFNVVPDYELVSINSEECGNNSKKMISETYQKAIQNKKKGVIVFSGRQCSLGVTIKMCDIVILLNNVMNYDLLFQMMFRCMTERKDKKCGFVIDLNIKRISNIFINYSSQINHPDKKSLKDGIKYLMEEKIININGFYQMVHYKNVWIDI